MKNNQNSMEKKKKKALFLYSTTENINARLLLFSVA